jgi:ARP2/3 complex subunit ARPC3
MPLPSPSRSSAADLAPPSPPLPKLHASSPLADNPHPQAYNSVFNSDPNISRLIGNFPLLPLRTKTRGPAYTLPAPNPPLPANESPDPDSESYDILDEVLALFRANTFFRNFEIQGPADRLLVYGIWFVSDCLTKIKPSATVREAQKDVTNLALDTNFAIPGDPGWPLNQVRSKSAVTRASPC